MSKPRLSFSASRRRLRGQVLLATRNGDPTLVTRGTRWSGEVAPNARCLDDIFWRVAEVFEVNEQPRNSRRCECLSLYT